MVITRPQTWYVCNKCGEWFQFPNDNSQKLCPNCKEGKLIKTCAFCGEKFDKCKCSK